MVNAKNLFGQKLGQDAAQVQLKIVQFLTQIVCWERFKQVNSDIQH